MLWMLGIYLIGVAFTFVTVKMDDFEFEALSSLLWPFFWIWVLREVNHGKFKFKRRK